MLGVSQVPPNMDSEDIDLDEIRELLDDTSNLGTEGKKVLATMMNNQALNTTPRFNCLCEGPTPSNTSFLASGGWGLPPPESRPF
eukprot:2619962-Pyramimonas_sp.AAC.1